jgi:PHP family Zn ribbon phosphoesterase
MNWRISSLDRFRLVSNSDAHSPAKLGREACLFDGERSYDGILRALRKGAGYVGTIEFFPEEGKYHADGHRACKVRLAPKEARELQEICPTCGKPVTVGVLNRVEALADRPEGSAPPATAGRVLSLIPLPEILGEILSAGAATKGVITTYESLLAKLGPELTILTQTSIEEIRRRGSTTLAEAMTRLRAGKVIREAGYDGEYGVIRLFAAGELSGRAKERELFGRLGTETGSSASA